MGAAAFGRRRTPADPGQQALPPGRPAHEAPVVLGRRGGIGGHQGRPILTLGKAFMLVWGRNWAEVNSSMKRLLLEKSM